VSKLERDLVRTLGVAMVLGGVIWLLHSLVFGP
jgi:hypothetical protein